MEPLDSVNDSVEQRTQFWSQPPPYQAELDHEGSDVRTIRLIVSITLGLTLVLAGGYLAAVVLSDGAILLRPSEVALQRHATYNELIQPAPDSLTGSGVVACIVDSGIAMDHADLEGVNLVGWKDFINGNGDPYDDHGHGTSMAGLLVANGWLKGVAKDVDLLVAKALGSDGSGSDAIVADAVDWCVQNGAHVISLSLGGAPNILPFSIGSGRTSGDAANEAIDAGVYVVAAAGNDGEDDDGDVAHPSSEAGVISVGGVTIKGTHWSGSSKGDNNGRLLPLPILMPRGDPNKKPEIVAPAEGVPVLTEDGAWGIADGTSAATVYVTGALCLLLEEKPDLKADVSENGADNVDAVKRWLMESAVPEEGQTTHDDYYGYGLLNVSGLIDLAIQA
ncbi:MAG: S8 family serine peptidase [Candidatus Thermoplasmatota archaeon]|nr:S8 family serine peptidase [Candidatus Thermoplasmatota archaeon]